MAQTYAGFLENFTLLLLVLSRVTGLFVVAPIFGRKNIPAYFKIGFSFFITLIVLNALPPNSVPQVTSIWAYAFLIAKELIVGIAIGYVGFIVFTGIYIAGQFIDMQIGFGIVSVMDPSSNIQVPISANFYYTITMLIFLITSGHHLLIRALYQSYSFVAIGAASFNDNILQDIFRIFGNIFTIGFKISAPIVAAVFITDICMGILTKTVPQLNVFVVGMPLKVMMGLMLIFISIPIFGMIVESLIKGMDTEMYEVIKHMGKTP